MVCDLKILEEKFNIYGGVIVLGYLIGVFGVCIIVLLLNELKYENKYIGVVFLCVGGGIGIVIIFEKV